MHTIFFTHSACVDHDPGPGHPECPDRLKAILQALEGEAFMFLDRREAPLATVDQIARAHPRRYVERVLELGPQDGYLAVDSDTVMSPGTVEAALRGSGAVCAAVDEVIADDNRNAFCAIRPPGHHAEAGRAMGFCFFNHVAVAAEHARAVHGLERVAVVDFDVHHGNGTQDIFWDRPGLFYASLHQSPLYPGTGLAKERGASDNILNVPLPAGAGSPEFRDAIQNRITPAVEAFAPELLILSAGFDAHTADPLAQMDVTEADFVWATNHLADLADRVCRGRLVSTLEGGYDLHALASSVAAHVRVLMER